MDPVISNGDFVIYKPLKKNYKVLKKGMIVVATHPKRKNFLIVKRISKVETNGLFLKGDNEEISEDSRKFGLIKMENINGIVQHIARSYTS